MDQARKALLDDYADRASHRGDALRATVLRTRSFAGRDLLAYLASGRRFGYDALVDTVRTTQLTTPDSSKELDVLIDRKWFAELARVLAVQSLSRTDREDAIRIYEILETHVGRIHLTRLEAKLFAESLMDEGRTSDVEGRFWDLPLASNERDLIRTDLANPFIGSGSRLGSYGAWVKSLEETMGHVTTRGLIAMRESDGKPFDRLASSGGVAERTGPLVSVILTTYRPDDGLLTAVRSILDQSWRSLELLVVDDGSPPEFESLLSRVSDMDLRVRVIRLAKNVGTYPARNVGLAAAAGEFVTFQDSDDWSHPLRIESQVMPMLDDSSLVATTSMCVRASDDLRLASTGYPLFTQNTSSLMIRTDEVIGRVGFMDGVRKAADTEYIRRIQVAFDGGHKRIDRPALSIVRRASGSLSRSEFLPGWHHQSRFAYREGYDRWHARIKAGATPFLDMSPKSRPFPAPSRFHSERPGTQEYDVVFVGDWRAYGGPQKSMVEEIRSLREVEAKIAVAHMESFRFMTSRRQPSLCEPLRSLEDAGDVTFVLLDEEISADLIILRYPPILQFPPHYPAEWSAERLWIVANQAPSEIDGSDVRYIPTECDSNARALFGLDPTWVPQGERIRSIIQGALPRGSLAPFDNPGIIRAEEWFRDHSPNPDGPFRIGRYSRDNHIKFPSEAEQLLSAYPVDDDFLVRMMGGRRTVEEVLGSHDIPATWRVSDTDEVPVEKFLEAIDFFVYFDNPLANEAFGRSLLEAIASGVVVIADPSHEPTFGPAVLYCDPSETRDLVRSLAARPPAYRDQVRVAQEVIQERFSPEAFRRIVASKIG